MENGFVRRCSFGVGLKKVVEMKLSETKKKSFSFAMSCVKVLFAVVCLVFFPTV